jgi:hypothetical protein
MEHESEPAPEQPGDEPQPKPTNWVGVIIKIIVGVIVLFVAVHVVSHDPDAIMPIPPLVGCPEGCL